LKDQSVLPGAIFYLSLLYQLTQSSPEFFAIIIVSGYLAPFYSPGNNMVQSTGCVYSGVSWKVFFLSCRLKYVDMNI